MEKETEKERERQKQAHRQTAVREAANKKRQTLKKAGRQAATSCISGQKTPTQELRNEFNLTETTRSIGRLPLKPVCFTPTWAVHQTEAIYAVHVWPGELLWIHLRKEFIRTESSLSFSCSKSLTLQWCLRLDNRKCPWNGPSNMLFNELSILSLVKANPLLIHKHIPRLLQTFPTPGPRMPRQELRYTCSNLLPLSLPERLDGKP